MLSQKIKTASFTRFISKSGMTLATTFGCRDLNACHVIHMGVALRNNLPNRAENRSMPNIICPAHLIEVKGHTYLLQAIAHLKKEGFNCRLMLAGSGELRERLVAQSIELEINSNCDFMGHIPKSDLISLYQNQLIDIIVMPSINLGMGHHEGIPVSLIEAMSYSIPAIATDTGGISELLTHEAGILIPEKNHIAIALAIKEAWNDKLHINKLGRNGRLVVEEQFNIHRNTSKLLDLMNGAKPLFKK